MFKNLLAKLAAMSLASKVIAVAAVAVIVVGGVAIGLTGQSPSVDPDDQQNAPQQEQQAGDIDRDDEDEASDVIADADGVVADDDKKDSNKIKDESKEEQTGIFVKKYTVKFETGEGSDLKKVRVLPGTAISSLDTPYCAEHIFLGWYYDEALTEPVESDDKVTKNLTLYADYLQQQPLETLETVNFASAEDVGTGFAISVVSADTSMTAEEVLAAITADDLTDPDAKDVITVSGSNGNFTVSGNGGFHEGGSYRITLNRDELTFKDQPESAREFNFTVHRDEVMNLTMQSDITYIPVSQVSNIINNGASVATLDLALYQTDGDSVSVSELSTGTFTYSGSLVVGDKVCIYEGALPTERNAETPKDQLGDMAYLTITAVSGSSYTYESTEAEDVLFMPDVLPMPENADADSAADTITVENKYLDYSADMYSYMNLDSQTTVDVGDFLAFYTGELGVESGENAGKLTGYGKVTNVAQNGNETTTVSFVTVTWDEVQACMDVYAQETLSGEELLEGVDTENMESEIEQQAYDSGFAEEAATYLTSLALATENFTALSDNMNLEDYKVTLTDGTPVSPETLQLMAGGGIGVEIDDISVKARVNTKPTHLGNIAGTSADEKGLSIGLEVTVVFSIASEDGDGKLEITVTGSFIEEVGVDFGVNADAVWDWAFIIPYISDIKVSANVDTMNYTGVSFNATMVTKENEDDGEDPVGDAMDMANEIKELLKYMTDNGDSGDEMQDKLVERYSEMLKAESDWIRVVEYNIVEVKKSVPFGIPLININFSVAFVIDMDASISVGFDFEYIEGKRHVFTVSVKNRDVYSDTIDLQEKTYQFCFYSMGRIGLKAGVEMDFSISVISASLGSVGFEAGAGAYTNLYGYFFYELKYTESQGKTQAYSGALLMDVGIYLEASLKAEALGGRYSAEAKILDKEWPMYEAGRRDNVLDFTTEQEDMPELVMKQFVRQVRLPDSAFNMDYLDLMTGEGKNAVYNDWNDPDRSNDFRNGANYTIKITNDKFIYDPVTNTITVNPDEEDLKLAGEMVITWNKKPMAFSSKPIQRTVSLYWDNLRDGYMIVPYTNGGSYVPLIVKNFEAKVTAPANPTRMGYTFGGWYTDSAFTTAYTFPELMPAADTSIYAKWLPKTNTPYTVEHYLEDFRSGEYQLTDTQTFRGTTDTYVTPETKTYTGYISPAQAQLKVEADGSATLRYYYTLERHNVTFDSGKIDGMEVTAEKDVTYNLKYGAEIPVPQMAMKGYTFVGWTVDGTTAVTPSLSMSTADLSYTAMWTKDNDTEYRVEYYVQQADGRYTLQHMIKGETVTGKVFTEEYLRSMLIDGKTADETFCLENAIVAENMTVKGIDCDEAAVDGSGKTVIKINYAREKHTLTFDPDYAGSEPIVKEIFYGAEVIAPQNVTRTGYTFAGWAVTPVATMPAESLTYKAQWTPNTYTVKFDKDNASATGTMENQSFTYDEAQNLTANGFARTYYTFSGWATQSAGAAKYDNGAGVSNLTAAPNGVVTLYATWTPVEYTITYEAAGAVHSNPTTYTTEDTITLTAPVKAGYTFGGWYDNASCTGTAVTEIPLGSGEDKTFYAKLTPNTDTAYSVEHYQEQLDGSYTLVDTDNLTGTTDTEVTPAVKNYEGFAAPEAQSVTIEGDGSLVVAYTYDRIEYTLTFDAAGGSVEPADITAKYGASITLPTPSRDGYGFKGWYNGVAAFNEATMPAENLTLTAQWAAGEYGYTVNHYQQNVDGIGYTVVSTVNDTAHMDSEVTPALNTYEGFTAPDSISITIEADAANNVVDYYYTRNQYTLTWELGSGSAEGQTYTSGSVYYGAAITAPDPAKIGYSYSWNAEPVTAMPASDLTYTANWTPNRYLVRFVPLGGVVSGDGSVADREVTFGTAYGALATLEKAGYTFKGWYDGETQITAETILKKDADHALNAKFDIINYNLTYNKVEEGEHSNPATYTVEKDTFALTAPTSRIGYTFEGWYGNDAFSGDAVAKIEKGSTGDKTFYAKWTENTYAVTFHAYNGSTVEETRNIRYTGVLGENTFERIGYTFLGWTDGTNTYGKDTKVSEVVTGNTESLHLYAAWEKNKYTISYVNVEADEHDNAAEYTVEDMVSLSAPDARVGYTFMGWYDNANFEGTAVETITVGSTGHKIFYANWEENTYTVVLNVNDGTGNFITTEPILYTGNLPANTFERAGYTFNGWTDGANTYNDLAAVSAIIGTANSENQVMLNAVWTADKYNITYIDPTALSGQQETTATYTVEQSVTLPSYSHKDTARYKFMGWYTDSAFTVPAADIPVGTTGHKDFYAKWEDAGSFSVVCTATGGPTASASYNATFKVVRDLIDGAVPSAENQTVYVRTQNGTAFGATTAGAEDNYHFEHCNKTLTFTAAHGDGSSLEFSVKERDSYLSNYAPSSYQIGNKARNYSVEIYNIVNDYANAGGLVGAVGTKSVTRTMPVSSYELTAAMYAAQTKAMTTTLYGGNYYTEECAVKDLFTGEENDYLNALNASYSIDGTFKLSKKTRVDFRVNGESTISRDYQAGTNSITGGSMDADTRVHIIFDPWDIRGEVSDVSFTVTRTDTAAPVAKYVAPLATTDYKAGDTAYITVVYSEPLNSVSGTPSLTLSSKLSPYFKDATYVDNGKGANALVFKVTAVKDISTQEIQNTVNGYLNFHVSGKGGTFASNIGTVSATVKDILGNPK